MPAQNVYNNPNRHSFMKSGQAGMIMSGMQHQSRTAVVSRSNVRAQVSANFDADTLTAGARIEFIFMMRQGVTVIPFPISAAIAGNNANITTALLTALRNDPRLNGYAEVAATSTATSIALTVTARFPNQPLSLEVQAVSATGAIVPGFATYGAPIVPMDDSMFMMSGLYPYPGLIVASAPTPVGGVQEVRLPNSAGDRVIGVVERRDPMINLPGGSLMPEMLEVVVEGDIRPWLENYATADDNVPAYRHTADGNNSQLGAVVCVPAGSPAPTGCAFFPDRLNARFVRSKSDGTITLALGN
jgi:hypothetical protein